MNNYSYVKESTVNLVASSKSWIESSAVDQLKEVAKLPGMRHVVGLPDLHPGKNAPVGAAFLSSGFIYPHLVGNDIGCGMSFWQTELSVNDMKLDKWTKNLKNIDDAWDGDSQEWLQKYNVNKDDFSSSLGTIGGGNHFAELQRVEVVCDQNLFEALKINKKSLYVLVHSGSRGVGEKILQAHLTAFNAQPLKEDTVEASTYLQKHNEAIVWAKANRDLIAYRFSNCLKTNSCKVLDLTHNWMERITVNDQQYWLHRKGATPANQGPVIIPGSRGDFSYLVLPKNASFVSGFSLAHGAGRKWSRKDAKGRLKNYRAEDFVRTSLGSNVICECKELLFEEAPQAYKKIDNVVQDLVDHNLVTVIARFRPVITYKTRRRP